MSGNEIPEIYCWEMPVGELQIHFASTRRGALRVGLSLERDVNCINFFRNLFPNSILMRDYQKNRPLIQGIEGALQHNHQHRAIDYDFTLSPFQWLVLETITGIAFGETKTYGEVAASVGKPKGARAVGQALGKNPLPLIFP
jgi:O6-methylguanine-DNA--protein-cysteine methyltransferase